LVEMVVVIVITGSIGGMVAMFIRAPVQGYMDSARRAELTDIADTAIRRMARDVRTAVPNSVRMSNCGTTQCVEYLPTKDGGRYRAGGAGNVLAFGSASSSFDIIGSAITFGANDQIVIGSTQSPPSIQPYDTTAGSGVRRPYIGTTGIPQTLVTITNPGAGLPISAQLDSQRFDVVDGTQQAVTYSCEGTLLTLDANGNGQASLKKHWGYGYNAAQQAPAALGGNPPAILADKVSDCQINYDVPNQRFGLLTVRLTLTSGGDSVSLYNEIHVNNVP